MIYKVYALSICMLLGICRCAVSQNEENIIIGKDYTLRLDNKTAGLSSFSRDKNELLYVQGGARPMFIIRLRNPKGNTIDFSSTDSDQMNLIKSKNDTAYIFTVNFSNIGNQHISAVASIVCPFNSSFTYWYLNLNNNTDNTIEFVDYPIVVVPNNLIATGGDGRIFRPSMEGAIIEDLKMRENTILGYPGMDYPTGGWAGYYPASCDLQFMAYYTKKAGLYFATHDHKGYVKGYNYNQYGDGIELKTRGFADAAKKGTYTIPYPIVIGGFQGNWYDAANIYRDWALPNIAGKWKKLKENPKIPDWFKESPVIVTYPVRGTRDTGQMKPNEYFPYIKGLPVLNKLSEDFSSKIMALLMHWEGTAPWAPPYAWPPYGGKESLNQFVKGLHQKGNLIGLYESGIGYTIQSYTDTSFSQKKELKVKKLRDIMVVDPFGNLPVHGNSSVQRTGYDMCPSQKLTKEIVYKEVNKILDNDIDYMQYFDQNQGGLGVSCFSTKHGHPNGPGKWMTDEMVNIYRQLNEEIDKSGKKMLLGTEGAAAEPFIPYLLLNDLRPSFNLFQGIPVPAYAYVYHEYINNFMGNQCVFSWMVDVKQSPLNLHQRIAYSFASGDLFTVVLGKAGNIIYDWGTSWEDDVPDQESIKTLVKNLNAWRNGIGKPYLLYGKMEKPFPIEGSYMIPMITLKGKTIPYQSIFTSKWTSPENKKSQLLVNYTSGPQTCKLKEVLSSKVKIFTSADGKFEERNVLKNDIVELKLPAYSAIMVEF